MGKYCVYFEGKYGVYIERKYGVFEEENICLFWGKIWCILKGTYAVYVEGIYGVYFKRKIWFYFERKYGAFWKENMVYFERKIWCLFEGKYGVYVVGIYCMLDFLILIVLWVYGVFYCFFDCMIAILHKKWFMVSVSFYTDPDIRMQCGYGGLVNPHMQIIIFMQYSKYNLIFRANTSDKDDDKWPFRKVSRQTMSTAWTFSIIGSEISQFDLSLYYNVSQQMHTTWLQVCVKLAGVSFSTYHHT